MRTASAQVVREPGRTVILLAGDLDLAARPLVEEVLGATGEAESVRIFDLRGIRFLDVAGLAIITDLNVALGGGRIAMYPSPAVRRLLGLLGVEDAYELLSGEGG